jgi:hypothetical protein
VTPPPVPQRDRRGDLAFGLLVGAAALDVLGVLLGLTRIGATVDAARGRPDADPATIGIYIGVGIGIVLAFELTEAVLLVVFGRLARRGVRWARFGLIVLVVLALLGFSEGTFVLGVLRLLLAATGTVLLLLRPGRTAVH